MESSPDVMLQVLCLPMPVSEKPGQGISWTKPSFGASATDVPRSLLSYSGKRELGMTKVTGITASYARCKLLKNFEGLRRPLRE